MPESTRSSAPKIPALSLLALRRALSAEVGADAAARALQAAGMVAGDALFRELAEERGGTDAVRSMDFPDFLARVSERLEAAGWGSLEEERLHAGVGGLRARTWVESEGQEGEGRPCCFFTTGMLANLLGSAAGAELAVLEVECRSQGDVHCRFAFGSEAALVGLYGSLAAGHDLESSLARLA